MRPNIVNRIARQEGCTVERGGRHWIIKYEGKTIAVAPFGTTRDRSGTPAETYLRQQIRRGKRGLA